MVMNHKIEIEAIGYINTKYSTREGVPHQGGESDESYGSITIRDEFLEGIKSLKPADKITVIFNFHKSQGFELTTIPFISKTPVGIFSTRSPDRPNSLGITVVEIIRVEQNCIEFKGADMLDGTPVVDIKPFI